MLLRSNIPTHPYTSHRLSLRFNHRVCSDLRALEGSVGIDFTWRSYARARMRVMCALITVFCIEQRATKSHHIPPGLVCL
jgi:hypothetical protein